MTDEKILQKAIEKAVNSGWKISFDMKLVEDHPIGMANLVIFRHDFAKAFWPTLTQELNWWQHLQIMVLEENPIKYLEQFLEK